uniref:RNase H type-1 domain-containing protein n=1 Tax=Amphilophus citrinellus TaxID=61819 RepID=A0A3Q0T9A0_AMPCI
HPENPTKPTRTAKEDRSTTCLPRSPQESATAEKTTQEDYDWTLFTDGSRKGPDDTAYWGFILKLKGKEQTRQRGKAPGSAQAGEVTAVLEGLLELEKRKIKRAKIITDSYYCAQALKEDLTIWEENGYETAKGKKVAHEDLWKKIAELRMNLDLERMAVQSGSNGDPRATAINGTGKYGVPSAKGPR